MRPPPRLLWGLAALVVLGVACLVGGSMASPLGDGDPVHAALLPPGTRVMVLDLADGRTLTSPEVELDNGEYRVHDRFGRDVLPRFLRGGRISLAIATLGALVALFVGLGVGLAAATGGRVVDSVLMRMVDAILAFPLLLLLILVSALFRPSPAMLVVVLGFTSWMGLARLVRGQVLSLRTRSFIQAARVAGTREHRIWSLHYLPNMKAPLAQDTALRMGILVLAEATLSFLGLGIPPGLPSWGAMIADGQRVMLDGWWLSLFPGLAITALVISLALIGDGIQQLGKASS